MQSIYNISRNLFIKCSRLSWSSRADFFSAELLWEGSGSWMLRLFQRALNIELSVNRVSARWPSFWTLAALCEHAAGISDGVIWKPEGPPVDRHSRSIFTQTQREKRSERERERWKCKHLTRPVDVYGGWWMEALGRQRGQREAMGGCLGRRGKDQLQSRSKRKETEMMICCLCQKAGGFV